MNQTSFRTSIGVPISMYFEFLIYSFLMQQCVYVHEYIRGWFLQREVLFYGYTLEDKRYLIVVEGSSFSLSICFSKLLIKMFSLHDIWDSV